MEARGIVGQFPDKELLDRNLKWRRWPLAHYAVPFTLTEAQRALLARAVPAVCRAAEAVVAAFSEDKALRALFGYASERERFILKEPGYRPLIPLGRLDAYLYRDSVKFMEYNTDGTAGWHYSGGLSALWRERAGLKPESAPLEKRLLEALLACYGRWSKGASPNTIAIADWRNVGTRPEQEALRRFFESRGFQASLEDPSNLRHEGGRLIGSRGPIDLLYRRVVSEELFARIGGVKGFVDAYWHGAFCCVGSFRTDPAWSKILFVVLSDPKWRFLFTKADGKVLSEVIPWTRLVCPEMADTAKGKELRAQLLLDRGHYLLKPAHSYQGAGVTAGALVSPEAWKSAVNLAFSQGTWVAQEYLEPVPWQPPHDGPRHFLQVGAFTAMGRWAGLMARVCESPVITPDSIDKFLPVGEEVPWETIS
jgi:glutathionylspermidine synthase